MSYKFLHRCVHLIVRSVDRIVPLDGPMIKYLSHVRPSQLEMMDAEYSLRLVACSNLFAARAFVLDTELRSRLPDGRNQSCFAPELSHIRQPKKKLMRSFSFISLPLLLLNIL